VTSSALGTTHETRQKDVGSDKLHHAPGVFTPSAATAWETAVKFAPISLFIVGGKLSTFLAYSHVSMSLAQTAKALEPVFNVALAWVLYREARSHLVQVSLIPIVVGVGMASIAEPSFHLIGFVAAVASGMLKVLQNIYTKKVMDTKELGFFQVHFWCATVSVAAAAPILVVDLLSSKGSWPSLPETAKVAGCVCLHYIGSIASYGVLSQVHHLTFTITNTMKR
jgi:drug/metabolite transporter (DMT)-like permease